MYPNPSDFNSADAGSAWITHTYPGQNPNICSMTGWDFLVNLQQTVHDRIDASPGNQLPTWDGTQVPSSAIVVNDPSVSGNAPWNQTLLEALWAVANADHAPQAYLDAIRSDAQAQQISAATIAAAAWEIEFSSGYVRSTGTDVYGQGSPDEVTVPQGVSLPTFGQVPPVPISGTGGSGFFCVAQPAAANIPAANTTVVPFQVNPWVALGIFAAAAVTLVVLSKDIPVEKRHANPRRRGADDPPWARTVTLGKKPSLGKCDYCGANAVTRRTVDAMRLPLCRAHAAEVDTWDWDFEQGAIPPFNLGGTGAR